MTPRAPKPVPLAWVVGSGLTRRLVEADSAPEALRLALAAIPRGQHLAGAETGLSVREATDSDRQAFSRRRARPPETMTLPMELPPPNRKRRAQGA